MRAEKEFNIRSSGFKKSDSADFFHYQGASYLILKRVFSDLVSETWRLDFFDIGCGKGRALFVAEHCGYNTLTGIELDPQLLAVARNNENSYALKRPGSAFRFIEANALDVQYHDRPTVYFLFNPFNAGVLDQVLAKVLASTTSETWFVYMNPVYRQVFAQKNIPIVREFRTRFYTEALVYAINRASARS